MSLTPKVLSFAVLVALAGTAAANPAADRALSLIAKHGAAVKASPADQYLVRDVIVDANGAEHARFDRTYRGLPVIGGDFVVHSDRGQFKSASLTMRNALNLDTRARLQPADAIVAAGAEFGSDFEGTPSASRVVYARGPGAAALAFKVDFQGADRNGHPIDMSYIVNAASGSVLDRWSNLHTGKPGGGTTTCSGGAAAGVGQTLYSGDVAISTQSCGTSFQMKDMTRGGGYTTNMAGGTRGSGTIFTDADNNWGTNLNSDAASAAADAHFGIAATWDYFQNTLGRTGIADNGVGALSKVHYGRNYANAFWSDACFCMTFGDGDGVTYGPLVDLDVAGHEMTHGVTSRSAKLIYSGESGGLNEATSDIFGTMVEFSVDNALDTPDYLIGEEIYISNPGNTKALRYMYRPNLDGNRSPNCYSSTLGSIDVHYSSGVANHFFYLLAEGSGARTYSGVDHTSPTCNGLTITGIGRDVAAKIWYRALTVYMTSSTNYAGARAATLSAASDLHGGTGSAQYAAVAAAWSAVSVN